jgi:hypothetical protein
MLEIKNPLLGIKPHAQGFETMGYGNKRESTQC